MGEVHDGHRERLRQRIEQEGIAGFQQHELLEYLLYYASARGDMNPLAHALIDRFGSLEAVLRAEEDELRTVKGMGARRAAWLKRVAALTDSYADLEWVDRPALCNLRQVRGFARAHFAGAAEEAVWQLCMAKNGMLLLNTRIADSAAWGESLTLRDALTDVLSVRAYSVVLLQLTGPRAPVPEDYDVERTQAYARTLTAVGVHLLDHVLMRGDELVSMAREGRMENAQRPAETGGLLMEQYLARE